MVRLKHRYLVVEFLYPNEPPNTAQKLPDIVHFRQPSSSNLTQQYLQNQVVRNNVAELFGDWGVGATSSSLKVVYLSQATSTAVIRAPRASYRLVWAALTYVTKLPMPISTPCVIQVVRVCGTIRKAQDEIIRRAKATILKVQLATAKMGQGDDHVVKMVEAARANEQRLLDQGIKDPDTGAEDSAGD